MIYNEELTYEQAREIKDSLESLFNHYGWKIFIEALQVRAQLREKELVQMCPESTKQMVRYSRIKGGIDELRLIETMMGQMLTDVTLFIQQAQEEAENGDDENSYFNPGDE